MRSFAGQVAITATVGQTKQRSNCGSDKTSLKLRVRQIVAQTACQTKYNSQNTRRKRQCETLCNLALVGLATKLPRVTTFLIELFCTDFSTLLRLSQVHYRP